MSDGYWIAVAATWIGCFVLAIIGRRCQRAAARAQRRSDLEDRRERRRYFRMIRRTFGEDMAPARRHERTAGERSR